MVLRKIKEDGTMILIRCLEQIDYIRFKNVLNAQFLPIYKSHNLFHQDSASWHKSRLVSSNMNKSMISILINWPAQSPDLNIIQFLWSELKASVASCKRGNIEELCKCCEKQQLFILKSKIKNLCESTVTVLKNGPPLDFKCK